MSYLVLARKYRPQRFAEVVGQRPVVQTLENALARDRVAHAMIFSGVRGVGKTTLARLMAKALNCSGEAPRPCGQCEHCLAMTDGTALDLHEIDGASNRGVQEIRDLKEEIRFLPSRGRFKIYIIDEVHMLTTEAFNALLKTLEEPPAHVYFMFATTELHKVPVTILSRCQRYELQRIPFKELVRFFARVAQREGVDIAANALELVAREAAGSVRDGLSLLDQIFSFGGTVITAEDVAAVLGVVDSRLHLNVVKALLGRRLADVLEQFHAACDAGVDLKRFANDLLGHMRALLLCRTCSDPGELLAYADTELAELKELAAGCSAATLYRDFQLLLDGVEAMQRAMQPRFVLEMAFIRICEADSVVPVSDLLTRLDGLLAAGKVPGPAEPSTPVPAAADAGGTTAAPVTVPQPKNTPAAGPAKKEEPTVALAGSPSVLERVLDRTPKDVKRDWEAFAKYVKERKPWMAHALMLCRRVRQREGTLVLQYDAPSDCKVLQEKEHVKILTEFAQDFFQTELAISFVVKGDEQSAASDGSSAQQARRALADDPLVSLVTEVFGGQVAGIRTGPRSR